MWNSYFNNCYKNQLILWHAKCFSIPKEKIQSYLRYRMRIIENVMIAYFLKRKGVKNAGNISLIERHDMCNKYNDYDLISGKERGSLYYKGHKIDLEKFLQGELVKKDIVDESLFVDLFSELK